MCYGIRDYQGYAQRRFWRGCVRAGTFRGDLHPDIREGHPVCLLQGAIHKQRNAHPRVPYRARVSLGVAHGGQLSGLLMRHSCPHKILREKITASSRCRRVMPSSPSAYGRECSVATTGMHTDG